MNIETKSNEMHWILAKFLKESLDHLSRPEVVGTSRRKWIKHWASMNLSDEDIELWMPKDEF